MPPPSNFAEIVDIGGGLASVIGLIITARVYFVAKDAKQAAQEALVLARSRNLVEELDDASQKLQQIGIFLHQQEWFGTQLRIDEIAAICRSALTRWPDHLSEMRRNDVLSAVQLVRSIASLSAELQGRQPTPAESRRLKTTHSKASELINDALGEARKAEERNGTKNGN